MRGAQARQLSFSSLLLGAALVGWCGIAAAGDGGLSAGIKAYERKEYDKARERLAPLATGGNAQAQYLMGRMYWRGKGGSYDKAKAVELFRLAALQGNADAQTELAQLVLRHQTEGADADVLAWLKGAAEQGHAEAQYELARLYDMGRLVATDHAQATALFSRCAEAELAECQAELGHAYAHGVGVEPDDARAARWLRKAAGAGEAEAMFDLAQLLLAGRGVPADPVAAVALLESANKKSSHDATRQLARFYLTGEHVARDKVRALFLASELGCEDGAPEIVARSIESMTDAQLAAATVKAIELVKSGDYASVYRALESLARRGIAPAQLQLGTLLMRAYGQPQDLVQAYMWISLGSAHSPEAAGPLKSQIAQTFAPAELESLNAHVAKWTPGPPGTCDTSKSKTVYPDPSTMSLPAIVTKIVPHYPELARRRRLESKAILQAVISAQGDVLEPCVLRINTPWEGFEEAAIEAVRRWKYRPATMSDGSPVEIYYTVVVDFELN